MPLYSPETHEPCTPRPWDADDARAAIAAIVADAEAAFSPEHLWPLHPLDYDEPADAGRSLSGVYLGAAGVIWALAELGGHGDHAAVAAGLDARCLAAPDYGDAAPGLWLGRAGILAVAERLAPDAGRRDLLHAVLEENVGNPAVEVMWGAPGSMLAASAFHRRTGEERFAAVWRRLADSVWAGWAEDADAGCRVWTQELYGSVTQYVGPVHGLAGCIAALAQRPDLLGSARVHELEEQAVRAAVALAVCEDGMANWRPIASRALDIAGATQIRTQWCHGAPGIVDTLARIAPGDDDFTALLVAGGELTWRAGPLRKGSTLCHGTAGNGLAFLALHGRTGEERWLERARSFGMHAMAQVEDARAAHGTGRHSLWTGDLGVALYLRGCIDPDSAPGIDLGIW